MELLVENEEIGGLAGGDAAQLPFAAGNPRRSKRSHANDIDERYAGQLEERPHAVIHAYDTGSERGAIGHETDAVAFENGFAAVERAHHVRAVGHIQSAVAIGDESQAIAALELVGK